MGERGIPTPVVPGDAGLTTGNGACSSKVGDGEPAETGDGDRGSAEADEAVEEHGEEREDHEEHGEEREDHVLFRMMLDAIDDDDKQRGESRLEHAVAAFYLRWLPRAKKALEANAMGMARSMGHADEAGGVTVDVYVDDSISSYFQPRLDRELRENLMARRIHRKEGTLTSLTHYGWSLIRWTCLNMRSDLPRKLGRANEELVGDMEASERLLDPDAPAVLPPPRSIPEPTGGSDRRRGRRPGRSDDPVYKCIESVDRLRWVLSQLDDVERDLWVRRDHYSLSYGEVIFGAPDVGLAGVAQLYPDIDWNPNQLAARLHRLRRCIERLGRDYDDPEARL